VSASLWLVSPCECCDVDLCHMTYNLTPMLREAGMPPWRDFIDMPAARASHIWRNVREKLVADPDRFKELNPPNGWGDYDGAVEQLGLMVDRCAKHPQLTVGGWL
jgi:hypothetical protein